MTSKQVDKRASNSGCAVVWPILPLPATFFLHSLPRWPQSRWPPGSQGLLGRGMNRDLVQEAVGLCDARWAVSPSRPGTLSDEPPDTGSCLSWRCIGQSTPVATHGPTVCCSRLSSARALRPLPAVPVEELPKAPRRALCTLCSQPEGCPVLQMLALEDSTIVHSP